MVAGVALAGTVAGVVIGGGTVAGAGDGADRRGVTRLALDGRIERAPEPSVEHQRLDHVTGHLRATEPAGDHRPARRAPSVVTALPAEHHQVPGIRPAITADHQARAGSEERLGHQELALAGQHRHPRCRARVSSRSGRRGHGNSAATVRSAAVNAVSVLAVGLV